MSIHLFSTNAVASCRNEGQVQMAKLTTSSKEHRNEVGRMPVEGMDALKADHAAAFIAVIFDELIADPKRIPATIKRKQLLADMVTLFHMHVSGKGNSTIDIARQVHVELLVVKNMLTPLVELGLLNWEYRGNHASRNGSGRVRHYFFSERLVKRTLQKVREQRSGRNN